MHPPSQRNTTIGLVGLVWFLFCTATAIVVPMDPDGFREWSRQSWTDQEIRIGAACYFVAGLGGLVLVVTRLVLPRLLARRPRIGDGLAPPLMSIPVVPDFKSFYAVRSRASARAADAAALSAVLAGAVIFILLIHPDWRRNGMTFKASVIAFSGTLVGLVGHKYLIGRTAASIKPLFWLRWKLRARNHEPRQCDLYEDGIHVRGRSFQFRLPWYDAKHATCLDDGIGFVGRGETVVIPARSLPSPEAFDQLMRLLERKGVLPRLGDDASRDPRPAALNTAARPG